MIKYDFTNLADAISRLKNKFNVNTSDLKTIKNELNKFFTDSNCKEVLYTTNIDRMFFGIKVMPIISTTSIYDLISDDDPYRIDTYMIEFDSKLFDPILNLDIEKIVSILLYEVSRLVNDSTPMENAIDTLNAYLYANKDNIKISDSIHYKDILGFGLRDYLSKVNSFFYIEDSDIFYSNEFLNAYGLAYDLGMAHDIIYRNFGSIYANAQVSKFAIFAWTLSVYRNLKIRRVGAINTLTRASAFTASRIEQTEYENMVKRIKHIDDNMVLESTIKERIAEKKRKHRLNNLKMIEGTYCELLMQIKNVEEEADALYLMRVINNNISILDDYAMEEQDEDMRQKWIKVLEQFKAMREKLANTAVYKNKNYGIFVNYPDIVENRY